MVATITVIIKGRDWFHWRLAGKVLTFAWSVADPMALGTIVVCTGGPIFDSWCDTATTYGTLALFVVGDVITNEVNHHGRHAHIIEVAITGALTFRIIITRPRLHTLASVATVVPALDLTLSGIGTDTPGIRTRVIVCRLCHTGFHMTDGAFHTMIDVLR